jgi:RNA recognition motif-containing protein
MNTKLYVGNLSFDTTENDLQDLFAACGPVSEVNLIMDRSTNRPRGFAFVTMATPEGATAAIAQVNGKSVQGRAITVNEARPREERPAGEGSRGGYGGGGGGGRGRQYSR